MVMLTILIFQYKNVVYLSICLCHLWFLSSASYSCLSTDPFVSLGRFISRYFIIFVVMVNKIVSSIFLSDLLLLLFINARVFFVLILYPTTLLNLLMSSSHFLMVSLGFSMYSIMSSANSDSFTSFPVWIPFISLSSLMIVAKTTNLCWINKVVRVDTLVLFLEEILSVFYQWELYLM